MAKTKQAQRRHYVKPERFHPKGYALTLAIDRSSDERVKAVLSAIIRALPKAELLARKMLLGLEESEPESEASGDKNGKGSSTETQEPGPKENKRGSEHSLTCRRCRRDFAVDENANDACHWHYGRRIVDSGHDIWDDWIESKHGVMEDFEEEHPEGFLWSCCDASGDDEKGCETGRHRAGERKKKRKINKYSYLDLL